MDDPADRPHTEVRHKALLAFAVMAAVLMQVLDTTIANVAIPHMRASLGATPDTISWVLTSYIVAAAIVTPAAGWLSDRLGMRNLMLLAVALFVGASMLCGLAQNLPQMVMARLVQGIGGATLAPLGQTVMLNINRPSEHPRALALMNMGIMTGPVLGPILGGWLTDNFDWRWVFLINVPLGLASIGLLWWLMPRTKPSGRPFDLAGWILIALALASLQLLIDRGEQVDWFDSPEAWIEAGVLAATAWMFCVHSMMARRPLFPASLWRDRSLMVGCFVNAVMATVQTGGLAMMPSLMQSLLGYSVLQTGTTLASRGLGITLALGLTGRLLPRLGPRPLILFGLALLVVALWNMTGWSLDMDSRPLVINGFFQGMGAGFVTMPAALAAFASLSPQFRTDGAALMNLARNTGGSIAIAVNTTLLARNMQVSHSDLAAHITPYNLPIDPTLLSAYGGPGEGALQAIDGMVQRQAAMVAYIDIFQFSLILVLCVAPFMLQLKGPRGRQAASPAAMD